MSLTRGRLAALAVAIVTVVGVGVLVGVFASGWWSGTGGSYAPRDVVASGTITPQSSLFADPLTAEMNVAIDSRRIDPATVQLAPSFGSFTVRSQREDVESGVDDATVVHFRYEIECIVAECVPLMGKRTGTGAIETTPIALPAAKLTARRRDGATFAERVAWPPFTVHSRLTAEEIGFSTPHTASWFSPPPVSWRLTPDLIGGVALALAVLLFLGSGFLVASVAAGDTRQLRLRRLPRLSPVERALRLAEHAAANGEVDEERKALERLAEELARVRHGELAEQARSLAWSERDPASNGLSSLAEALRSNGAR